ncbi:B3/B4 domain-containing protein [Sulfobacillus thermosulfidooxidans]|uniref:B3/B4 domain-containing protein n=1 Tax=Sulfobacillus thermosulfidooxidans TaxID=28034 RepID=UPI0006B4EF21|nr:phenylalanine--tRNA ligase beta subunit-related protein [Sulfobacillus thermosulfidooxidans]
MSLKDPILIDPEVCRRYGALHIGWRLVRSLGAVEPDIFLTRWIAQSQASLKPQLMQLPTCDNHIQAYRRLLRQMGVDPTSKRSSVEALWKRIRATSVWPIIHPLVDLTHVLSLKYRVSTALYDWDRCTPPIVLRLARRDEPHWGIGDTEPVTLPEGTLVYADTQQVLCRHYNHRDAVPTQVTADTKNAVLIVDGAPGIDLGVVRQLLNEWELLVSTFLGGVVSDAGLVSCPEG